MVQSWGFRMNWRSVLVRAALFGELLYAGRGHESVLCHLLLGTPF